MRHERPSLTASIVAAARALYTAMPEPYRIAPDPVAAHLVSLPLSLPARALGRLAGAGRAAPLVHEALGVVTFGISTHVPLRTRAIDDALRAAVALGATEIVVLGAGLDARALRLEELASATVFEVDHPSTQRLKLARLGALADAPHTTARSLVHVPVDFERERLADELVRRGFQPSRRSFWIWEGVTMYLTRDAIEATLRAVAGLSSPGSRVAMTYGVPRIEGVPAWAPAIARQLLATIGEPLRTDFLPEQCAALLQGAGFSPLEDSSAPEWAARYWPPSERPVPSLERLVVAERRAD